MQYIPIARIVNTFGIKGQLRILVDTDFPDQRFQVGNRLFILDKGLLVLDVTVDDFVPNKGAYLVRFEGLHNINLVEKYKGMDLAIHESDQEELEEDAYYHHQIIGLEVYTLEGDHLGKIKDILALGSNDVWVVEPAQAKQKEILIPFISDVVKKVDLEAGRVEIELMEGLIDEG